MEPVDKIHDPPAVFSRHGPGSGTRKPLAHPEFQEYPAPGARQLPARRFSARNSGSSTFQQNNSLLFSEGYEITPKSVGKWQHYGIVARHQWPVFTARSAWHDMCLNSITL